MLELIALFLLLPESNFVIFLDRRLRTGSWSENEIRDVESPVYSTSTSTSTSRTSDYDRSFSSDRKEATVSRNSSSGISVASKNSFGREEDLEHTATLRKDNPFRFPRKLSTVMSGRNSQDDEGDSLLFAGPGEYCKDLFRGESLDWVEKEQREIPVTFSRVLTINLVTSENQSSDELMAAESSLQRKSVEDILEDSDLEITRV